MERLKRLVSICCAVVVVASCSPDGQRTGWKEERVPEGFAQRDGSFASPEALLDALLPPSSEGGSRVVKLSARGEGTVGTVLEEGLPDDSVAGKETRVRMTKADNGWHVTSLERRLICRRGVATDSDLCV